MTSVVITRDDFVDGYMERSKLDRQHRTVNGFAIDGHARIALPCGCEDDDCPGWAMVTDDPRLIESHKMLYDPDPKVRSALWIAVNGRSVKLKP